MADPTISIKRSKFNKMLNEAYREGQSKARETMNDLGSYEVLSKLLGLPCKVLSQEYGWNITQLEQFATKMIEEYTNDESSFEEMSEWIYENVGLKFEMQKEVSQNGCE